VGRREYKSLLPLRLAGASMFICDCTSSSVRMHVSLEIYIGAVYDVNLAPDAIGELQKNLKIIFTK